MVLRGNAGLVIFVGCAHNGILNMIKTVKMNFPNDPIKAIIGGFHLRNIPILNIMVENKKTLKNISNMITKINVEKVYTGHCTGMKAFNFLKRNLGQTLFHIVTGDTIEI